MKKPRKPRRRMLLRDYYRIHLSRYIHWEE